MKAWFLCATALAVVPAAADPLAITAFEKDGSLTFSSTNTQGYYCVEWASSPSGPWRTTWNELVGLDAAVLGSAPTLSVPTVYRIVWHDGCADRSQDGMMLVPAGCFSMGDSIGEGFPDEVPVHTVYVSSFLIDRNEVTLELWEEVRAWGVAHGYAFTHDGASKGTSHPVHGINWYDIVKWCNARSEREARTPVYRTDAGKGEVYRSGWISPSNDAVLWGCDGYRLPTEAEWEKAARGGATFHRFPWSDADTISHVRANYESAPVDPYDVSVTRGHHPDHGTMPQPFTSPVGSFAANAYGLHDMAGNLSEWCWDRAAYDWYEQPAATDPDVRGPPTGLYRILRGGSWDDAARDLRCARRVSLNPDSYGQREGFRCVCRP